MARIRILDPTARPPEVDPAPGPDLAAATLHSGRIGIRFDPTWRSFDFVRDEWSRAFGDRGARVESWRAGDRSGDAGVRTRRELGQFVHANDVVVAGLGN